MNDIISVTGTVLRADPQGERDKRIVIESRELGKITAFARGVQRPGNALMAAANPFVTGKFSLLAGTSAYRLVDAEVLEYFRELASLMPGVYYGFYFLDLADYYGREGIDGTDMLNLLYLSLKALQSPNLEDNLVRRIFEIRLFTQNGDFAPDRASEDSSMQAILQYICYTPLKKLFTFKLESDKIIQLSRIADKTAERVVDRRLKSLDILETLL